MKRFSPWLAAAGVCGSAMFPVAAQSGTTGHVGVFSEYVFRGITANGNSAVQGGIDYLGANGVLGGIWASSANAFGGSELDVYAGYLHKISDTVMVDVGALYYLLTEDEEVAILDFNGDGTPERENLDTLELFVTLFAGPIKAQVYYSPDYLSTSDEAYYYTATYTHKFNDTINVAVQAGYTHGDAPEAIYGDDYVDYSLTLNKTVREGLVFSLAAIDTTLTAEDRFQGSDDDTKILISAKQTFPF